MKNILIALTGSVATTLFDKMEAIFTEKFDKVTFIGTEKSKYFLTPMQQRKVLFDSAEFDYQFYQKDDPILHIDLCKNHSALLVMPCSANTLAKISSGICDNLVTSVVRAWKDDRYMVICPAMNTYMWEKTITIQQIRNIKDSYNKVLIINPIEKTLACGDIGVGGLADLNEIANSVDKLFQWQFPFDFKDMHHIPTGDEPGAFLAKRRNNHTHTGIDIYCDEDRSVYAVEPGTVISIENFTGPSAGSPWWKDTQCVLVEGATGVVCYGEIKPNWQIKVGSKVVKGHYIGSVKRVILEGKEHPEIPHWKPSMLHLELYPHGTKKASDSYEESKGYLQDPTPYLMQSF